MNNARRPWLSIVGTGALAGAALPALAGAMAAPHVTIVAPSAGAVVTSATIPVEADVDHFAVGCSHVGQPGVIGRGHIHAMIDGMTMANLTNFYCSKTFTFSGLGLSPGKHTLAVLAAGDAHDMASMPAMTTFDYEPAAPQALPHATTDDAHPSVTIVSPKTAAIVGKKFDLKIAVSNFDLSCDLEGKANIAGYGHLHVFVSQPGITDRPSTSPKMAMPATAAGGERHDDAMGGKMAAMPSMSMIGMIGMPCTTTVPVDLSAWKTGKAHVLVMLANDDHMPTMGGAPSAIDVTVR